MIGHRSGMACLACCTAASVAWVRPTQSARIVVEERWRATGAAGIPAFGAVEGMVETATGAIWISDPLNRAVTSTDAVGRRLRLIAREGDGPGEVRSPTLLAPVPSGGIAVYDQGHDAVELFSGDERFIRRVPLSAKVLNPKGFAVLHSGEILLSGGLASGRGGAIHRFGPDGRLRSSWAAVAAARDPRAVGLVSGGPITALRGGEILYSQAAPHRISLYNASGRRRPIASERSVVPPIGDDFIQRRDGMRMFQWRFPQSAGVFRLADGNILNVVWNAPANTSTWEIYRPSGSLVARTRIARAYRAWALARNGDVLATVVNPETGEVVVVRLAFRLA